MGAPKLDALEGDNNVFQSTGYAPMDNSTRVVAPLLGGSVLWPEYTSHGEGHCHPQSQGESRAFPVAPDPDGASSLRAEATAMGYPLHILAMWQWGTEPCGALPPLLFGPVLSGAASRFLSAPP